MNPLERLKDIFGEAVLLPAAERAAYLDTACGGDTLLRSEVEELLKAYDGPGYGTLPTPAAEPETLAAGATLAGRYTLMDVIGEGGMGRVWKARQSVPVQRDVAVKIVRAGRDSRAVLNRFDAERQALALMDHPGIARVFDGGTCGGSPYFVMEYVRGVPITDFATNLDLNPRLKLITAVCKAVQHAHTKGVIHRDLKPANILVQMIDGVPVAKVIDFGVAKAVGGRLTNESLAETGLLIGTPQYMAPEQAESSPDIDTRADVYALGAVLYELVTGKPPLPAGGSLLELLKRIREEEPLPPGRGELDWIILKALAKRRDERYDSPAALAADLERHLAHEPVEARAPTPGYRVRKFVRRNRGAVIAASLVFASLLGGIVASLLALKEAREQEGIAHRARNDEATARQQAEENAAAAIAARNDAVKQRAIAEDERDQAVGMRQFLRRDLLQQADAAQRAEDLRSRGREYHANPRVKDLLDRAYVSLAPDKIHQRFPNKSLQGSILSTVGDTYLLIGEHAKAIEVLERVAALGVELHGAESDLTLTARYNLGLACLYDLQYARAAALFEDVLAVRKRLHGPDALDVLGAQNALASCWTEMKRVKEGVALLETTRDALLRTVGPDHRTTVATRNNLALAHQSLNDFPKAIGIFKEIVATQSRVLGPEHPDTLTMQANLAAALHLGGRSDEALTLFRQISETRLRVLGPDHRSTASTLNRLAKVHRERGEWPAAIAAYEKAHAAYARIRGAEDAATLIIANNLAWTYQRGGQLDKAVELYESVLATQTRTLGRGHSDTLTTLTNLGLAYGKQNRPDRAGKLLAESARGSEALKFDHANSEIIVGEYVDHLMANEDYKEAAAWRRKLVARAKAVHGRDSPNYTTQCYRLTVALVAGENYADAVTVYREILEVVLKNAPENWSRYNVESEFGYALFKLNESVEAEKYLLSGWNGMKNLQKTIPAGSKVKLPLALDRLIEFYNAAKKPDEAAKWKLLREAYQ